MDDIQKRIQAVEKEIRETPYHKGTEHHIGLLRARLAKLKDQFVDGQTRRRRGSGGSSGFALRKQGDATVVLVGFPSVGKSTLLNKLTNARSRVAPYAFTTVTVIPGIMHYQGARIQVLDVPGLLEGASFGRGRGREVLSVVRSADLLLIMADIRHPEDLEKISGELENNGVRINKERPKVEIKKTAQGGLRINFAVKQDLSRETIKDICREFKISNAEVTLKEKLDMERLIDVFSRNRVYVPALYVLNKIDAVYGEALNKLKPAELLKSTVQGVALISLISADKDLGLDRLKKAIWEKLSLVRIYLKGRDGKTDYREPMIVGKGSTLNEVMTKVGQDFAVGKKSAKIWGPGARVPGQSVSLATPVVDQMEVEFTG